MSEDLIKVVIDYNLSFSENKTDISTGNFIKIHEGMKIDKNLNPNS
jgi:hypothetical protein